LRALVFVGSMALGIVVAPGISAPMKVGLAAPASLESASVGPPGAFQSPGASVDSEYPPLALARMVLEQDLAALGISRPSYPFWRYIFMIPDGSVAFGSAWDGRLLASFPNQGDWMQAGQWEDPSLSGLLQGQPLPTDISRRRDQVAEILEPSVGPVVHNATRGNFLIPNVRTYGGFMAEWGAIYERFGAPAEIGLAQALVESGFSGTVRSRANAVGLCQWLKPNWDRLDRLTPFPIEVQNQTTQAAYCAAYLTVLATKYGSFIPALSEHHAGIANVGRVLVNGGWLGAEDVRNRYFAGAEFARDLRAISPRQFRDLVGTYGPRSFLYSEMVFGNTSNVLSILESVPQERIYAVRVSRPVSMDEIVRRAGLTQAEVKRFNPALFRQVPRGATLYLPRPVEGFGTDVTFWHRPAPEAFTSVLHDFVRLDVPQETWWDPAFDATLSAFRHRFRATECEEGMVMDAVLGYLVQDLRSGRSVLARYNANPRVLRVFEDGVQQRQAAQAVRESPR
jgi:hypothetical protein